MNEREQEKAPATADAADGDGREAPRSAAEGGPPQGDGSAVPRTEATDQAVAEAPGLDALLEYLKRTRGFDFTGYKRASLWRRIHKRMEIAGIASCGSYVDYLEVHPEEFGLLFDTILINVTAFFRDPPGWDFLASELIPRIVAGKAPG